MAALVVLAAACTSTPPPTPEATVRASIATQAPATPKPTPAATALPAVARALPGAVGSPGCDAPLQKAGDTAIELTIDGAARSALVHAPPRLAGGTPLPLVLVFHGAYGDGPGMVELTGFSDLADAEGFLVAYPSAIGDRQAWNTPEARDQADDVGFERALVDRLEAEACVDQRRVYAAGLSMGGAMAQLAACRDNRIVAISLVAAVHGKAGTTCRPRRAVPAVSIHGLLDPLVPWRGGLNPLPEFADHPPYQDILDWAAEWAVHNGCDREPEQGDIIGAWVVPFAWQGCRAPVVVYRVNDGGHTWPGAAGSTVFGAINQDIDATELSVEFFLDNALPPEPRIFESVRFGYRVRIPDGWAGPWVGRYGYHQEVNGAVTFPVGQPVTFDLWATQMVLSAGTIRSGVPTPGGLLPGRTPKELAKHLIDDVPGYAVSDLRVHVDGEKAIVLEGAAGGPRLPLAAVFTHGDRAFLLFVYHEVPIEPDDLAPLNAFLDGFEFTA